MVCDTAAAGLGVRGVVTPCACATADVNKHNAHEACLIFVSMVVVFCKRCFGLLNYIFQPAHCCGRLFRRLIRMIEGFFTVFIFRGGERFSFVLYCR